MSARKPSKGLGRDAPIEERAPQIIRILSETYPDARVALNFSSPLEWSRTGTRDHPVQVGGKIREVEMAMTVDQHGHAFSSAST